MKISDIESLNNDSYIRMKQITSSNISMDWENPEFFDVLLGYLPKIRYTQHDNDASDEIRLLHTIYEKYDAFETDKNKFLEEVKRSISEIRSKSPKWYGLDYYSVENIIAQHRFTLISGEGGIGKSYFLFKLEQEFKRGGIPHLCLYGKFEKDISRIPVQEIISVARDRGFVFIFDAINEMTEDGQRNLLTLVKQFSCESKLRIILSYRTNAMDSSIVNEYENAASALYRFPGVSFESALSELIKLSIPDVYKYEDILYSNNALLMNMLCTALDDNKIVNEVENSVASITFILEHYIKKSLAKTFKGTIASEQPLSIWKDTKNVARWMYEHNTKSIDEQSLLNTVKNGNVFIETMRQLGFLDQYERDGNEQFFFAIDSLTDFLIARSLFEDISGKSFEKQKQIIISKTGNLYNMDEAIILALFDNLSPDYEYIAKLLKATDLIGALQYETLVKINFRPENISKFIDCFKPVETDRLLTIFGGYTDKPFNCVNYLNTYYRGSSRQCKELSSSLEGRYIFSNVKARLKNILYFVTTHRGEGRRVEEAFYFSLWCSGAPNRDVRCLAMKLLYEIVRQNIGYKDILIKEYNNIIDSYIKEAIIYTLANLSSGDNTVNSFFRELIESDNELTDKSIRRIAFYLGDKYKYINWNRPDLYVFNPEAKISDELNHHMFLMDLMNKDYFPFRYWGKDHVDMHTRFLAEDKNVVTDLNQWLEENYNCVRMGCCNGVVSLKDKILYKKGENDFDDALVDMNSFFESFEVVIKEIFSKYSIPYDDDAKISGKDILDSLYMKAIDISKGIFYGSLMCNHYTDSFVSYNSYQDCIGFEVYDPIEYGEDTYIATPVPTYQDYVERLGDIIVNRLEVPDNKDIAWVKNIDLTRTNLIGLLDPVSSKNNTWIMIAGRVCVQGHEEDSLEWRDTYNLYCCTSNETTICADGSARYLTIELDDYAGDLIDYKDITEKSFLCKGVKNISSSTDILDETSLVLPPAELIQFFKLKPEYSDLSWRNVNGEIVILCNNNKNSYYRDPIGGTVFIKEESYNEFIASGNALKFFAFTERYIPMTGYADETSMHFEIQNHRIIKEIPNNRYEREDWFSGANPLCDRCPHTIEKNYNEPIDEETQEMLDKIFEDYGG